MILVLFGLGCECPIVPLLDDVGDVVQITYDPGSVRILVPQQVVGRVGVAVDGAGKARGIIVR